MLDMELHPSDFEAWRGCDKRFELTTLRREPPAWRHPAAVNGTAIHAVIGWIHSDKLWDKDRDFLATIYADEFHDAIENPIRPEERGVRIAWGDMGDEFGARAKYAADALTMLDGYRADQRNKDAKLLLSEGRWRAELAGFKFAGTLDQARDLGDGTVELVDLKSGVERRDEVPLKLWGQGLTYAIALQHADFSSITDERWAPLSLRVARVTWAHLQDYVPYKKKSVRAGRTYLLGDMRGPVFYPIEVTAQALASHAAELHMFAESVASGRFPRRPSNYECSRCKVAEACLLGFHGSLDAATVASLNVTEGDYESQANGG